MTVNQTTIVIDCSQCGSQILFDRMLKLDIERAVRPWVPDWNQFDESQNDNANTNYQRAFNNQSSNNKQKYAFLLYVSF